MPLVAQRVQELTMANLQDAARAAARQHDWAAVERTLRRAEEMARDNPWLQETLETLRGIAAERDAVMLSKEALYSSRRMRTRLAMSMDAAEGPTPDYLRRKGAQGRAAPRDKR
jgi:Ca-activated chloride channel homolog